MPYLLFSPQLPPSTLIQAESTSCPIKLAENKSVSVIMSLSPGKTESQFFFFLNWEIEFVCVVLEQKTTTTVGFLKSFHLYLS